MGQHSASQSFDSLQQAAQAAAMLAHNPMAMNTHKPPGLRYGSGAPKTRSTGARRSGCSRDRATVRSPGCSSVPVSLGPQATQDQTEACDSTLNRVDSMESRMRAKAQTMTDTLSDLAE